MEQYSRRYEASWNRAKLRKCTYASCQTRDPEFILECCDHVIELHKGAVLRNYDLDSEGRKELVDFLKIAEDRFLIRSRNL